MKTSQVTYSKDNLRRTKSFEYWFDILMGGFITSGIMILIGTLLLMKMNLTLWLYPYYVLCVGIVIYYQWYDDKLEVIKTGLSKTQNFDLVTSSLDQLDWHYNKRSDQVILDLNKYILKFLSPTIVLDNEEIYINFKYHSTSKTGRLPFFFGISTFIKWKFKKVITKQLLKVV